MTSLANRRFAAFAAGRFVSGLGDVTLSTVLVLWIVGTVAHGQPWSPVAISALLVAEAAPTIMVGPVAGVFVERWDKSRTMLAADIFRAVLIVLLLAVAVLASIAAQFFNPASVATLGRLVDPGDMHRTSGLLQTLSGVSTMLGAGFASALYSWAGVQWAMSIDALSFVVSFVSLLVVRSALGPESRNAPSPAHSFRLQLLAGWTFIRRSRVMVALLVSSALVSLGGGALSALDVFFVTHNLHAPAPVYGLLGSAWGLGAIIGAALTPAVADRLGGARVFWVALTAVGGLVILYARQSSVTPALLLLGAIGMLMSAVQVVIVPLVLDVTPQDLIARVIAIMTPLVTVTAMASVAMAGALDGTVLSRFHASVLGLTLGPVDTIFMAAGLLIVAGGLFARSSVLSSANTSQEDEIIVLR